MLFGGPSAAVIWAGYSLGPLPRLHACRSFDDGTPCPGPLAWPLVLITAGAPSATSGGRICWIDGATGEPGQRPGHGNYFCLLSYDRDQRERFRERFGAFGFFQAPRHLPRKRRDLVSEIRAALAVQPLSKRALARTINACSADVRRIVDDLAAAGEVVRDGSRWRLASQENRK